MYYISADCHIRVTKKKHLVWIIPKVLRRYGRDLDTGNGRDRPQGWQTQDGVRELKEQGRDAWIGQGN